LVRLGLFGGYAFTFDVRFGQAESFHSIVFYKIKRAKATILRIGTTRITRINTKNTACFALIRVIRGYLLLVSANMDLPEFVNIFPKRAKLS
jgi:hypothetical protein